VAKELPRDLNQRIPRFQAKRVPHRLRPEDVLESVVMFRASTRIGRKDANGEQQYTADGDVILDEFSPGDDVPEWVIRHCDFSSLVKQGRIYVRPWPKSTANPTPAVWDYKESKSIGVKEPQEDTVEAAPGFSLRELKSLTDKATIKNLRNALTLAGVEYSQAASKSELHALRRETLGIEEEGTVEAGFEVENG